MTILFNVNQLTLRQAITPARLQGRMNAIVRFMYWSPSAAGFAVGGAIASQIGLRAALWVSLIGSTVSMLPLAFSSVRQIRTLPEPEPEIRAAAPVLADA